MHWASFNPTKKNYQPPKPKPKPRTRKRKFWKSKNRDKHSTDKKKHEQKRKRKLILTKTKNTTKRRNAVLVAELTYWHFAFIWRYFNAKTFCILPFVYHWDSREFSAKKKLTKSRAKYSVDLKLAWLSAKKKSQRKVKLNEKPLTAEGKKENTELNWI